MLPYSTRRQRLADTMRAHGGGIAIAFTALEVARNRDSEYPYRWDSYFHYLTGFPEPEAALVLVVDGATTESLVMRSGLRVSTVTPSIGAASPAWREASTSAMRMGTSSASSGPQAMPAST